MNSDFRSVISALRAGSPVVIDVPAYTRFFLLQRYLDMSARNGKLGILAFALMLFGMAYEVPLAPRIVLFMVFCGAQLYRVRLATRLVRRMDPMNPRSSAAHDLMLLAVASMWGCAPFLLSNLVSSENLFGISYGTFVIIAVMSLSYHSALPASFALAAVTFIPVVAFLGTQSTLMFNALAAATVLSLVAMLSRLVIGHRMLLESLTAQEDNARLVEELHSYRHALESENASLGTSLRDASQAASRDPLTGLYNRRYLGSLAEPLSELVDSRREEIAICMVDVDHFKRINDTHGHPIGDKVLQSVAALLNARVRDGDCLARYGGEEFLIVLRRCDINRACAVAESVRQHIASSTIKLEVGMVDLTVSVGLASWAPNEDFSAVVTRADRALYQAKRSGRNRVQVDADDGMLLRTRPGNARLAEKLH